jgi:hypothetical protein
MIVHKKLQQTAHFNVLRAHLKIANKTLKKRPYENLELQLLALIKKVGRMDGPH